MNARINTPLRIAAVAGVVSVIAAAVVTPADAADGSGDVSVVNTETVQVYTSSTGEPQTRRVYEQLSLLGQGTVDLTNPISTDHARNLDGFSGVDIKNGKQVVSTTVDGKKNYRSVSNYDGKLPLSVSVVYKLNGKTVKPADVVGKDGKLDVQYTVENVTGAPQEVSYPDGKGGTVTKTVDVPIPMVGSLDLVAPPSFENVTSKAANVAGDGEGGTKLSFTMTLFPPIGSTTAVFGYSADITDGVVPRAEISALPINPMKSPTFSGAATSYKGGADTGAQLAVGATTIDSNLLKLRDGAGDLLAGLIKLRDGAGQLNDGLANQAAPGSQKLAKGASDLNDGLAGEAAPGSKKLAAGAAKLDSGLGQINAGSKKLADGTGEALAGSKKLDSGAQKLAAGLQSAESKAPALIGGLGDVREGLVLVNGGLTKLHGGIGDVPNNPDYQRLLAGLDEMSKGVGDTSKVGSLVWGVDQVRNGLATKAVPGIGRMKAGIFNNPSADNPTPGAFQKLSCATAVLKNMRDGVTAAASDPCYASASNPTGVRPPMPGFTPPSSPDQATWNLDNLRWYVLNNVVTGLQDGLPKLYDTDPNNNATDPSLYEGLDQLLSGLVSQSPTDPGAIPALSQIECGLDNLSLGTPTCNALRPGKDGLRQGLQQVSAGVPQLVNTIVKTVQDAVGKTSDQPANQTLRGGINGLIGGVDQLSAGGGDLIAGLGLLSDGSGQLAAGTGDLSAGLGQLDAGAGKLAAGTGDAKDGSAQLSAGATKLADGLVAAADGSGLLAVGAKTLASGLQDAADGSGQLVGGLGQAADGAPKIVDGAQQLSDQGTKKLIEAGTTTAQSYGEMYATITAGAKRGSTEDMAFGAPADAVGLTAYSYIIKGDDGEGGRNWTRGVGGLALLGAGGAVFALRRRLV